MKTLVYAHRGASAYAPENTLPAFEMARDMHADGIELDVQFSKDRKLVVVHDEYLDRVSDGSGFVKDYTLEELRKMNFNKTHPEYAFAQIPTLAEVYELIRPTSLWINVELKTGVFPYPGIEEALLSLTREMGMEERVIYSSFNHYSLVRLRTLSFSVKTGLLHLDNILDVASYAKDKVKVNALHPPFYFLQDPSYIKEAKEQGLLVRPWTVNEESYMRLCRDLGVHAMITNFPDVCRKVLEEEKKEGGV